MLNFHFYLLFSIIFFVNVFGADNRVSSGESSGSVSPIRTTVENQYTGAHGVGYHKTRVKTNFKAGIEVAKGAGCTVKGICRSIVRKSDKDARESAKTHFDKANGLRKESKELGTKHKEYKSIQSPSPEDARARISQNAKMKGQRAKANVVHA